MKPMQVCLDIMMPKVDGIKAVKTIRSLEKQNNIVKKAKVIMTTALSEKEVVEDSFTKGSDAFATKPLDIEKLQEVIRKFGLIE
jgi:two-component system chemotaxis response regulator CheY